MQERGILEVLRRMQNNTEEKTVEILKEHGSGRNKMHTLYLDYNVIKKTIMTCKKHLIDRFKESPQTPSTAPVQKRRLRYKNQPKPLPERSTSMASAAEITSKQTESLKEKIQKSLGALIKLMRNYNKDNQITPALTECNQHIKITC